MVDLDGDSEHGGRVNAELLLEQFRARDLLLVVAASINTAINTVAVASDGGDDGGDNEGDRLRAHLSTEKACLALAGCVASSIK